MKVKLASAKMLTAIESIKAVLIIVSAWQYELGRYRQVTAKYQPVVPSNYLKYNRRCGEERREIIIGMPMMTWHFRK